MIDTAGYIILGLAAGTLSGLIGIGGGVIIVPALLFIFGFSQHQAQGTTLALMEPPIGILAAWTYYRQGFVDMRVAVLICLGFLLGGLIGSKLAVRIPNILLERIFGFSLLAVSIKMILAK
ncbi:MAG: TSUP family transporter [Spirochaetes bacterium]|jgi:hypothetical protein|nr:TSUP family transporter [Spirochaetota bacterium]